MGHRQHLTLRHRARDRHAAAGGAVDAWHCGACNAGDGLGRAVAIDVTRGHRDGLADLSVCQHQGVAVGASDSNARGIPLVADRPEAIGISQRVRSRQRLAFCDSACDRHTTSGHVVDVGHRRGRAARHRLARAVAVDVTGHNRDGLADLGLGQHPCARSGTADVGATRRPLVADRTQPIGIGQRVAGGQRLALRGGAFNDHAAAGYAVDAGNHGGRATRHSLDRAVAIGITGRNSDRLANLRVCQHQGVAVGASDSDARGIPLVADHPQAIGISQCVGSRQRLAFCDGAGYRHSARRQFIHVGHSYCRAARNRLGRAVTIDIARSHADDLADHGLGQHQGAACRASDVGACRRPLVADRAHAVGVGQVVGGRQRLALSGAASDRDRASGQVIDVGHRRGRAARHRLGCVTAIGVVGHHRDGFADQRLGQHQAAGDGTSKVAARCLPLVADHAQAVSIGQGVGHQQRLTLCCRTGDRHAARRRLVCGGWCLRDVVDSCRCTGTPRCDRQRLSPLGQQVCCNRNRDCGCAAGVHCCGSTQQSTCHIGSTDACQGVRDRCARRHVGGRQRERGSQPFIHRQTVRNDQICWRRAGPKGDQVIGVVNSIGGARDFQIVVSDSSRIEDVRSADFRDPTAQRVTVCIIGSQIIITIVSSWRLKIHVHQAHSCRAELEIVNVRTAGQSRRDRLKCDHGVRCGSAAVWFVLLCTRKRVCSEFQVVARWIASIDPRIVSAGGLKLHA